LDRRKWKCGRGWWHITLSSLSAKDNVE
jgi:hypothetical protein